MMESTLTIEWNGDIPLPHVQLHRYVKHEIQGTIEGNPEQNRVYFEGLEYGSYLITFNYEMNGITYSSCYFLFDVPDISFIQLKIMDYRCQIEQMGFINDHGEFVDMLLYEGKKPFFTFPLKKGGLHERLCHFLIDEYPTLDNFQRKQAIHKLLPDLAEAYSSLEKLWPYQLRKLVHSALLGKTTPEWKACLLQLVRNDLILMENERLLSILQDAIEYAQDSDRVEFLLTLMEWDPDKEDWTDFPFFIEEISGHGVLKQR